MKTGGLKTPFTPSGRTVRNRQRRQLSDWLSEWRLDQVLRRTDASAAPPKRWRKIPPEGTSLAAGQIRLMYPDTMATRYRPLYLLLVEELPSGNWLAAPFGSLAVPAIPGEWRTGLRALPLRVLSVWNGRRIVRARLTRSWPAADFTSGRLHAARCLAAAFFATDVTDAACPLPAAELGPPLEHPLDPRHEYLARETERLDDLGPPWRSFRAGLHLRGWPSSAPQPGTVPYPFTDGAARLLAAEDKAKYALSQGTKLNRRSRANKSKKKT